MATTLSKFLLLGLSLDEVIAMATVAPAAALGPSGAGLGALAIGAEADVTFSGWRRIGPCWWTRTASCARPASGWSRPLCSVAGVRVPIQPQATEPPKGIAPG